MSLQIWDAVPVRLLIFKPIQNPCFTGITGNVAWFFPGPALNLTVEIMKRIDLTETSSHALPLFQKETLIAVS